MKYHSDPSHWLFIVMTFALLMCALSYGTQWCEWERCERGYCHTLKLYAEPEDNAAILFDCIDRDINCTYICYPINDKGEILKDKKWQLPSKTSSNRSSFG